MPFTQHPSSIVETEEIGDGTRIGAFTHVRAGAKIGVDCFLGAQVSVGDGVRIGNRVLIQNGACISDGAWIEDDVFIGPNVTLADGGFPRPSSPGERTGVIIRRGAAIGAGAVLMPGVTVDVKARVHSGAVVTLDVPPHAIVTGNPARIVGYEDVPPLTATPWREPPQAAEVHPTGVRGVTLHRLPYIEDLRGYLSFAEFGQHLPFLVKRYFVVFDVATKEIRGEHAHRELEQFLVCVHGSCNIIVDDGENREEFELDRPNLGVYIPPMIWSVQYKYSRDGVLLVLASDVYKPEDYIRDYNEFKALCAKS